MTNSKLPVRDVMVSPVITIDVNENVKNAATIMLKNGIGGLVILEDSVPVGIITERDFVGLLAKKENPAEIPIKSVMSKKLITISPNEGVLDAAQLIVKSGKRKIPVMENDKLIGIITADDIVRAAPGESETLRELTKIKSEDILFNEDASTEGECESCGNYAKTLIQAGDQYVCEECRRALEDGS